MAHRPRGHHPHSTTGAASSFLFGSDGHILSSDERLEVRRKAGVCLVCGLVQTHERPRKGLFTRLNLRPITKEGEVYKGHHLACHGGLVGAKTKLGERVTSEDREYDRRRGVSASPAAVGKKKKGRKAPTRKGDAGASPATGSFDVAVHSPVPPAAAAATTMMDQEGAPDVRNAGHNAEAGQHGPGLHSELFLPAPQAHQQPPSNPPFRSLGAQRPNDPALPHGRQIPAATANPPVTEVNTSIGLQRFDSLSTLGAPSEYLDAQLRELAGGVGPFPAQPTSSPGGREAPSLNPEERRRARQVDAVNQYQERMALMRIAAVEGAGGSGDLRGGDASDGGGSGSGGGGGEGGGGRLRHERGESMPDMPTDNPSPLPRNHRHVLSLDSVYSPSSPSSESPPQRKPTRFALLRGRTSKAPRLPSIADAGAGGDEAASDARGSSQHELTANDRGSASEKAAPPPPLAAAPSERIQGDRPSSAVCSAPGDSDVGDEDFPEMTEVPSAPSPAGMTEAVAASASSQHSSFRSSSLLMALDDLDGDDMEEGVRRVVEAARGRDYQAVLACVKTHRTSADVARAACKVIRVRLVSIALGGDDSGDGARVAHESSKAGERTDVDIKKKKKQKPPSQSPAIDMLRLLPGAWVKVLTNAASVEHTFDPSVQAEVLRTMWALAALADRQKSEVKECGGIEMALAAMGRHPGDADVQMYGSGLLGCLAGSDRHGGSVRGARGSAAALVKAVEFESSPTSSMSSARGGENGEGGGKREVEKEKESDGAAVAECALRALFQLTTFAVRIQGESGGRDWASEFADVGGTAAVAGAMKAHESSSGVQGWACRLLWILFSVTRKGALSSIDEDNGGEEKVEIESNEGKVGGGNASFVEVKEFETMLEATQDLVDALKLAAKFHANDPFVATSALGLLVNLSASSALTESAKMARAAAEVTAKIMKANQESLDMIRSGCVVLSNICSGHGRAKSDSDVNAANECRSAFANSGGVEVIVGILQNHTGNSRLDLQSEACRALTALCVEAAWNKEKVVNAGGMRLVISAYRNQIGRSGPGTKELREEACGTLASLAVGRAHVSALNGSGIMVDLIKNAVDEGLAAPSSGKVRSHGSVVIPLLMLNLLSASCSSGDGAAKAATTSTVVKFVLQNYRSEKEAESALSMLQALTTVQDCVDVVIRSSIALDRIVYAMDSFGESATVQEQACGLFSNLYVFAGLRHRDETDVFGLGLEIELIARALRTHPFREGVEERACLALRNFCAVAPLPTISHAAVLPVLISAIEEAVKVVNRSGHNPAVKENAVGFIWALARVSEAVCASVASSPDVITRITESLREYSDIETLQLETVGAMEALSRLPNTHLSMGSTTAIDALLRCVSTYDNHEDLVACGCSVLAALSGRSHQVKVWIIDHQLTIPRTISFMYQYPGSAIIQGSACAILANIAVDNYIREQIVSEGGISLIQGVMNAHRSDEWVMENACEAVANLISGAQSDILLGNDIIQKVISVIEAYPRSERIQERCMAALWNLSVKGPEFKRDIARLRGIQAIVRTMKDYISSEHVQEKGCVTLWSLAVSDANQIEIGRADGVRAIVNGSLAHIGNAQLQSEAIGALRTLATNLDNKERIRDCGGVNAIVLAMWVHYTNASIQESAFSALTNTAVNPITNQVSTMSKNELEAIISAMKRFPLTENLQQQACILLRNYTFAPQNIRLMKSNSLVFDLLQQAAENFPSACSERVIYIVDQLF